MMRAPLIAIVLCSASAAVCAQSANKTVTGLHSCFQLARGVDSVCSTPANDEAQRLDCLEKARAMLIECLEHIPPETSAVSVPRQMLSPGTVQPELPIGTVSPEVTARSGSSEMPSGTVLASHPFTLTSADFAANGGNGVKLSKQIGLPGNHRHTTGIAVSDPSSTDFVMAKELTKVLAADDDGSLRDLQIYPTVGPGGLQPVRDVLTLPSTDLAIASIPVINKLRAARTYGDIGQQLVLVGNLMTEELHVLAPKHIADIHDLAGKTVSLGPTGSLSATLGHDILAALDAKAREVNLDFDKAIREMRAGKIAAILLISGKPVRHIAEHALPAELHFLSVPYLPAFEGDFVRSALTHDDYPRVIEGTEVGTIGIRCALWAYHWPEQNERFRLVEMVIEGLAKHLHELQSGANHPKWKETDLSGSVSGWSRFDLSKAAAAQNGKPKL